MGYKYGHHHWGEKLYSRWPDWWDPKDCAPNPWQIEPCAPLPWIQGSGSRPRWKPATAVARAGKRGSRA